MRELSNAELDAEIVRLDERRGAKYSFTLFQDIELEPRKTWLVNDYLGAGELSCWFGPPGSAKSLLLGDLAAHAASGRLWFSRRVKQCGVLYVAIERSALVKRRLAAFRNYHGVEEMPLAVLSGQIDLRTSKDGAEVVIEHARKLADLTGVELGLIIIETVSRALAGGDENSPKDMGALVGNLALIQERTGGHVAISHHIPADGTQRLRGHGALLGACDTTIKVESLGEVRAASVDKVNDGPEGERVAFKIEGVELHFDPETGVHTTAPVVIPSEAIPIMQPAGPRLSANQQTVLNMLHDAGGDGLEQDEWFDRAKNLGIGKNRPATLYDIRKALKDKRLVHEYAGRWYFSF